MPDASDGPDTPDRPDDPDRPPTPQPVGPVAAAAPAPARLRNWRERLHQTLWFEGLGLLMITPLFAWLTGTTGGESLMLMVPMSLAVMSWAAVYNTLFDRIELRRTGRRASDRPTAWRIVHAIGLEASAVLLTWPLIVAFTPLGWWAALVVDLGLVLTYMAYGYLFHWAYDRLRPVG